MMSYVKDIAEFPSEPFWMIVWDDTIHIPANERSKTDPGHGYPERTERITRMQVFTDKNELKEEVERITLSRIGVPNKIRVFGSEEVHFETKIEFSSLS